MKSLILTSVFELAASVLFTQCKRSHKPSYAAGPLH